MQLLQMISVMHHSSCNQLQETEPRLIAVILLIILASEKTINAVGRTGLAWGQSGVACLVCLGCGRLLVVALGGV